MPKYLPPYPSLASLRNQAKQLRNAFRTQEPDALRRLRQFHPHPDSSLPDLRLADAQLALAREYGIASWPQLKQRVEVLNQLSAAVPVAAADGISPAFFEQRLKLRSHLPKGRVLALQCRDTQPKKDGVQRLVVDYSADVAEPMPSSFIYKFNTKGKNRAHPSATREAFFYQVLVPQMLDFEAVTCFDMGINEQAGQSYLVFQDLEATHHLPPAAGVSPYGGWLSFQDTTAEEFAAIAHKLARFQARWWDAPIIHREPLVAPSPGLGSLNDTGNLQQVASRLQELAQIEQDLPADVVGVVRRAIARFPDLYMRRLESKQHLTLIHGDFHLRSVFLPDDPARHDIMIIDWETVQRSIGVSDIAHLLISSMLPAPMRRTLEEQILAEYHRELLRCGVEGYSLDDCRADYRLSIVGLMGTVLAPPFLKAGMAAFADWGCSEMLK